VLPKAKGAFSEPERHKLDQFYILLIRSNLLPNRWLHPHWKAATPIVLPTLNKPEYLPKSLNEIANSSELPLFFHSKSLDRISSVSR